MQGKIDKQPPQERGIEESLPQRKISRRFMGHPTPKPATPKAKGTWKRKGERSGSG